MAVDACEDIRDLLVDFADGELAPEAANRVARHAEVCPPCAARVEALRRSLFLAGRVWDADRATQSDALPDVRPGRSKGPSLMRAALAVAAMIALAVAAWTQLRAPATDPTAPVESHHGGIAANRADDRPDASASDADEIQTAIEEVEAAIWKAGAAARMVASAEMLADAPGGKRFAAERLRVVINEYADTPSATIARSRLALLGDTNQ